MGCQDIFGTRLGGNTGDSGVACDVADEEDLIRAILEFDVWRSRGDMERPNFDLGTDGEDG